MKTITTLAAIAALVAGISVASAQQSGSDSSGGMKSSAGSGRVTGNGQFCIQMSKSTGGIECKYASMTACEKDAQPQGLQCSPNPNQGTTGAK
jgi:hypothetical protein